MRQRKRKIGKNFFDCLPGCLTNSSQNHLWKCIKYSVDNAHGKFRAFFNSWIY